MSIPFQDEIQRIGDTIGLKGKFLIEWGTDDIIREFRACKGVNADKVRALERLDVAMEQLTSAIEIIANMED
jgi:hypothetical protein